MKRAHREPGYQDETSENAPRKPDTLSHLAYPWITLEVNNQLESLGETDAQKRYLLLYLLLLLSELPTKLDRSVDMRI